MRRQPIYVETAIRGSMEKLWRKTQEPDLHKRWDVRFTDIEYLPRESEDAPQLFLYATRIGFGMRIEGKVETVASVDTAGGGRTLALKFWSDDFKSLISTGSGYWKYVSTANGVRFLTLYDYDTRFGAPGAVLDSLIFRPLMGWATAWSFDRLRLWIDHDVEPGVAFRLSCIHALSRIAAAFVMFYHGLVPKWLFQQPDEVLPLLRVGFTQPDALLLMKACGALEVAFAVVILLCWKQRWPFFVIAAGMLFALIGVGAAAPELLFKAFNAVTTNVMLFSLSIVGIISMKDLPSASRCLRKPPAHERH